MKTCSKCGIEKDFSFFNKMAKSIDGYRPDCKDCRKIESKNSRIKNSDKLKVYFSCYYTKNKQKLKWYHKGWRDENKDKLRGYSKQLYKKDLHENRQKRNAYLKLKRENDPLFKLRQNVRSRVKMFIRTSQISTNKNTNILLGCNYETLKMYLESKFQVGMSWDNYGEWHIDHIKPLFLAKNEEELITLCNYKNLQPLWAKDNLIKGKIY